MGGSWETVGRVGRERGESEERGRREWGESRESGERVGREWGESRESVERVGLEYPVKCYVEIFCLSVSPLFLTK